MFFTLNLQGAQEPKSEEFFAATTKPSLSSLLYSISLLPHPGNEHGHCFSHVMNCAGEWAEIHNCILKPRPTTHHQINKIFLIFLMYVKKHGKAWARGYSCPSSLFLGRYKDTFTNMYKYMHMFFQPIHEQLQATTAA